MAPNNGCVSGFSLLIASLSLAMGLAIPASARADNGSVAYARPASGIVINGDLADWPQNAQRFEIDNTHGPVAWRDAAYFKAAYDPSGEALYVAVVVEDASTVSVDGNLPFAANHDLHLLYVDARHSPRGSVGWRFGASETRAANISDALSFDPATARANDDRAEVAVVRNGDRLIYEWRIELDARVQAGMSLGFDHLLVDADTGEGALDVAVTLWGAYGGKRAMAGRLGDLVLLGENEALGQLEGRAVWEADIDFANVYERFVHIRSQADPELWVAARVDEDGRYAVALPPGRYCVRWAHPNYIVSAGVRVAPNTVVCQSVEADAATQAPDLLLRSMTRPESLIAESGVLFSFDDDAARRLDEFMDAHMAYFFVPGASIAVIRDGEIVYSREYGVANWLTGEPVRSDHLFHVQSVTKPVFAFAVMRLVEDGVLELDRPLHEYLPFDDIAHDERSRLFTARLVLSHQTGLPNWRSENDGGQLDIAFTPGAAYRYSGEGYEYLGRVIEHLTGADLETILMREAAGPLGMSEGVRFTRRDDWHDRFANSHFEHRTNINHPADQARASYSLHASAIDVAQALRTFMRRGGGLSESGYEAMFTEHVDTRSAATETDWPAHHGLGPRIVHTPFGRLIGHSGAGTGWIAHMEFYEDHQAGYAVVFNGENARYLGPALRRFLVAGQAYTVLESDVD